MQVLPALTKGGAERVTVELANHAARAGHDVSLVAAYPVDDRLLRHELDPSITVHYMTAARSRLRPYLALVRWFVRHRAWISTQDVVHCHLTFGTVFASLVQAFRWLRRGRSPRVVETIHSVGMPVPTLGRCVHGMLAKSRDALALMANDAFWDAIVAHRSGRKISTMIENGVRTDLPTATAAGKAFRQKHKIDEQALVVGSIGRLVPARLPWRVADTFAAIGCDMPDSVSFLIGGDGESAQRVSDVITMRGIAGRTLMLGLISDTRAPLAAMDLYVTLNVGPVTGIAALEAVVAGVPVVALQLLDDHDGAGDWIWSDVEPDLVARHCLALLRDPVARKVLATRQHAYLMERRSVDSMAAAYYAFYDAARATATTMSGKH